MKKILEILDQLSDLLKDPDAPYEEISALYEKFQAERKSLISRYRPEDLQGYNDAFENRIKEISKKLDDYIAGKSAEAVQVKNEISKLYNRKKLISYQR